MRKTLFVAGALAGTLLAAPAARAQTVTNGKAFQLTPYAGYMAYGNMFDGPFGTTLKSANGPLYGAQLGMKLSPIVALIGNVAYSGSDVKAGVPFFGDVSVAQSRLLMMDAGVQVDIPTGTLPVRPFVQAGAGALRYDLKQSGITANATNFAANVGGGVDIPLGRTAAVRLMAKDYIARFDFKDASEFNVQGRTSQNVALTAGLRLDF
jgi:opacity protein-like surface antigen